jgi:hypothetical protein
MTGHPRPPRRPARMPVTRTLHGERRPVVLIVLCGRCGNREVGWAWRDRSGLLYSRAIRPMRTAAGAPRQSTLGFGAARCLESYCRGCSGDVITREAIDPATLAGEATRRVRAYPWGFE